jgi:hypothetical protein
VRTPSLIAAAIGLLVLGSHDRTAAQSLTYNSGQTASPAYEGWEENPDGSFSLLFGYMNRNWQEELDVPIGPDNNIEPGGPDFGQPTHFLPRRNRFVFKVHVPKDWGDKELIWTLTTRGKTDKAFATLRLDSKVDDVVKASETGALGAGTSSPEVRANRAPTIKLDGDRQRTVKVGEPLSLVAWVSDDGVPKRRGQGVVGSNTRTRGSDEFFALFGTKNPAMIPPSRATVGKVVGLHLSWFLYRGSGHVRIDPPQVEVWEDTRTGANSPWAPLWTPPESSADGKWTATATFDEPGTYVLDARADDGALVSDEQITVTVTR